MYDYDAFGNQQDVPGYDADGETNPFRYCGEYLDAETDTYYLRARNYNPATGRFLTEDTYGGNPSDPLSLNLYTYCWNNPIRLVDPSGHDPVPAWAQNINLGKGMEADYQEALEIHESGLASAWVGSARKQVDKAIDTAIQHKAKSGVNAASVKIPTGPPNSSEPIYDKKGNKVGERFYGPDGQATKDRDDTDHGHPKQHPDVPHEHEWGPEGRGGAVPVPKPSENSNIISGNDVGEAAGWVLAGTILYWAISEGSRILFPPRNLIPVP